MTDNVVIELPKRKRGRPRKNPVGIEDAITNITGEPTPKALRGVKRRPRPVPVHDDPRKELKRLVKQDKNWVNTARRMKLMTTDRKMKETGEIVPCQLPDDTKADIKAAYERLDEHRAQIARAIAPELKRMAIYTLFLDKIRGCGLGTAAYICAMVDIHRATKSSALRRYCGYATDMKGRLEGRDGGPKYAPNGDLTNGTGTYNSDIRAAIYLMFASMWKTKGDNTSKYLEVWRNVRRRELQKGSPKGKAFKKGFHKAADLFIEDLYIVWRAIEGLDVWPSYYAAKLGYEHGGKICVNEPKRLTVEEALTLVANDLEGHEVPPGYWKTGESEEEEPASAAE